jgi:starch synthase
VPRVNPAGQLQCIPIESTGVHFDVPIGSKTVSGTFLKSYLPDSSVPVYLVHQENYFNRAGLYQEDGQDYRDNCERFVFFCRAVLEVVVILPTPPDAITLAGI